MTGEDAGLVQPERRSSADVPTILLAFYILVPQRKDREHNYYCSHGVFQCFLLPTTNTHMFFYAVVLTAFLGGESSGTVRSWALCGLRLPLSLKNSEHVGNGSVMIFRTLQFQFSECSSLCGSLLMFLIFTRSFLVNPTRKPDSGKFLMEFRSIYLCFSLLVLPTNKIQFKNKNKNGNMDILEKLE